jgi:HSP20 family molecular chaperone IbpA
MKGEMTMTRALAEATVPTAAEQAGLTASEEKTRQEERYTAPAVDIYETDDGLVLLADLAGVESKDLTVTVENGVLTIQARGRSAAAPAEPPCAWREFSLPNFWRQFQLSDKVNPEKINADLNHGVLTLHLPKAEAVKPRQIDVKVA